MPIDRKRNMHRPKSQRTTPLGRAIAKRVRETRLARGFTQQYVEQQGGLATGAMSRIEGGERAMLISVHTIVIVARILNADVGWLITGIVPDGNWRPPMGVTGKRIT